MEYKNENWDCICSCCSYEHQVHFNYWEETGDDGTVGREMFMQIHLADRPFWQRLKHGLAYIFGHKSRFGEFDEIILSGKHAEAFREIADRREKMEG